MKLFTWQDIAAALRAKKNVGAPLTEIESAILILIGKRERVVAELRARARARQQAYRRRDNGKLV